MKIVLVDIAIAFKFVASTLVQSALQGFILYFTNEELIEIPVCVTSHLSWILGRTSIPSETCTSRLNFDFSLLLGHKLWFIKYGP